MKIRRKIMSCVKYFMSSNNNVKNNNKDSYIPPVSFVNASDHIFNTMNNTPEIHSEPIIEMHSEVNLPVEEVEPEKFMWDNIKEFVKISYINVLLPIILTTTIIVLAPIYVPLYIIGKTGILVLKNPYPNN